MHTVSRRGFLVIGGTGAAGVVLAGCGEGSTGPREEGRDPELLAAALAAETALAEAYGAASGSGAEGQAYATFERASQDRADELSTLAITAGSEPADEPGEGPADLTDAADGAIAAYREAAGPLSNAELRGTAIAYLAAVAAEVATLAALGGDQPAPRAFVTGGEEEPYVAADDSADEEDSETTTEDGEQTTGGEETTGEEQP